MAYHDRTLLRFQLHADHIYKINGSELIYQFADSQSVTFNKQFDPPEPIRFTNDTLNEMFKTGEVEVEMWGLRPPALRPNSSSPKPDIFISSLPIEQREFIDLKEAWVLEILERYERGDILMTAKSLNENMFSLRKGVMERFSHSYSHEDMQNVLPSSKKKSRSKQTPRGREMAIRVYSPRTLMRWTRSFKEFGKSGLVEQFADSGNRLKRLPLDTLVIMANVVQDHYLTRERKTQKQVLEALKIAVSEENNSRKAAGKPPLHCPSRDTLARHIKGLDKFHVKIARFGLERAVKDMSPVFKGVETSRSFERVEIDEWDIDLLFFMRLSGLTKFLNAEEIEAFRFNDETARWWVTAAIDCHTKCIVGLCLTPKPRASSSIECLKQIVSDKSDIADAANSIAPWDMFATPEKIVTDNGKAFTAGQFTSAVSDLGITSGRTAAGEPSMRGQIERVFRTLSQTLMPRLSGRTFGSIAERDEYPSEERACLSPEDFTNILVRHIVDIYHHSPHEGLLGATPIEAWYAALNNGNGPMLSAPNVQCKRRVFGTMKSYKLQKTGIKILDVRYQSKELARLFMQDGNKDLDVVWNADDIGEISVKVGKEKWITVPSVFDGHKGMDATTWQEVRKAASRRSTEDASVTEAIVQAAIKDIEAINASSKAARGIIDKPLNQEILERLESEALQSFDIIPERPEPEITEGMGQRVAPKLPEQPAFNPDTHKNAPASKRSTKRRWHIDKSGVNGGGSHD